MGTAVFASILVALDGSAPSAAAFDLALRLAAPDGEVIVTHVINRSEVIAECITPYGGDPTPALEALNHDEDGLFADASARAGRAGVRCSSVPMDGHASRCIDRLARERGVDAIVMGTHARRGVARLVLGSTAAGVLHALAVPAIVVHDRPDGRPAAPFQQILVAFDASPAAGRAARTGVDVAAHDGAGVLFAHVAEHGADARAVETALASARVYAIARGVSSDSAVIHGAPVDAILIAAETCHADLIALGAHGRRDFFDMGGVAESVVRRSPVPALVCPSAAATERAPVPASTNRAGVS